MQDRQKWVNVKIIYKSECPESNHPFLKCLVCQCLSHDVNLTTYLDRDDSGKYFDIKPDSIF